MKTHSLAEWLKAGNYYRNKGKYEKALEAFAQVRLALLADMGECLTKLGNMDEARVLFEEILEADIRYIRANMGLGIVYILSGDLEQAALAFSNVLHLAPRNSKALCGLGMARLKAGQIDEGAKLLMGALEESPDNQAALNELVAFAKGDEGKLYRSKVAKRCREYLERHPDACDVREQLAVLESSEQTKVATTETLAALITAFQEDPYQRLTVLALAEQLGKAGQRQDGKNVCSVYLKRYPNDGEVLALQSSL